MSSGQHIKGDSAPLLHSSDTPSAEQPPALGTQHKKDVEMLDSREGHGDAPRAGDSLLWSQAGRARDVQLEEEKAPGRDQSPFQCLKGLQES